MNVEVGKPYPPMAQYGEGVVFDIDDAGAKLFYNYSHPTEDKIAAMHIGQPFQIRFVELGGIIWILSKCGALAWNVAPYNPATSTSAVLQYSVDEQELSLTLAMLDASTNIVKSGRLIGLGTDFSRALVEAILRIQQHPLTAQETNSAINATMAKYQTRDLVKMAAHSFKMVMTMDNAQSRYDRKNRTLVSIMLNRKYDGDIIERLAREDNKQGFIKKIIREEIKRELNDKGEAE